jgi:pentatricopeptide repeat protein
LIESYHNFISASSKYQIIMAQSTTATVTTSMTSKMTICCASSLLSLLLLLVLPLQSSSFLSLQFHHYFYTRDEVPHTLLLAYLQSTLTQSSSCHYYGWNCHSRGKSFSLFSDKYQSTQLHARTDKRIDPEPQSSTLLQSTSLTSKSTPPSYSASFNTTKQKYASTEDLATYEMNLQLAALAEQCSQRGSVLAARQALDLLRHNMTHPDTVAYNSVLKALAKVVPARIYGVPASVWADTLLHTMKEKYDNQVRDNWAWYEDLSRGILNETTLHAGPPRVRVKPNVRSFATVMDAWSRQGDLDAAHRAEAVLQDCAQRFADTGDEALRPNRIAYNTLLSAYAHCAAVDDCLDILAQMPVAPDVISYNACLHAIARAGGPEAGEQAEVLLRSMTVAPNARSYTTCMDAWSQSLQPARAHALLEELLQVYNRTQHVSVRPNAVSFSTVIHAYAVSKDPEKAHKAYQVLQLMSKYNVEPNRVTYNNLLNACASSVKSSPHDMTLIKQVYATVISHHSPDAATFGTVLKACSKLSVKDTEFAVAVFREACQRGLVSPGVQWQFRQAVPMDTYRPLMGGSNAADWHSLPASWRRNVQEQGSSSTFRRSQKR